MTQVALVQELLDRERGGEEVEVAHPAAGLGDLPRVLVAVPELGLEIGAKVVVDHELRERQRASRSITPSASAVRPSSDSTP